jgi:crotonobetainyl-CoA:carnitine CoA-transferase CaiB-like acyl-CoA transferase
VLDRLVERADVVTTNWRPGAAARLGLGFEALHARYPRLVFCNTRGFEKGPRSDLPGTDQTAAALTGTEWMDGACDSGNPPLWSRSNMGDTGNALLAAIAITSALYHRDRTGEGQHVSTSIVNAGLLHTSYAWVHADGIPSDWGQVDAQQYGLARYYRMYPCADDTWLFVAAIESQQQAALDALSDDLEATFATRVAGDWFVELDQSGVPAEVVDETFCRAMFDDPEMRAAGLVSETRSGSVGRFEDPGLLIGFSDTPGAVQRGPSHCGEHTRELLVEHGYSSEEVDALVAERAVLDAPADHRAA